MTNINTLKSLPDNLKSILKKTNIHSLYPPQVEALKKGVLSNKNMILAMPTAAGKTLIAELVMLQTLLEKKGSCLYIVPLRALASEKFEDFKKKYSYLGIRIGIATGDFDYVDPDLIGNDIIIATAEKTDSLLRQKADWLCSTLACVIVDEIHYLGDPQRGPTLETVITRLLLINPRLKILGLSATIANANSIAGWLNAELTKSLWRPVRLKEGVYCQGEIKFADGQSKHLKLDKTHDDIAALAIDCLQDKGQVLVFVTTRRIAQAEARRISKQTSYVLTPQERKQLAQLSADIHNSGRETTKVSKQLSECLKNGVVFHHAGLHYAHRKLIEDNFRNNIIKVICATPTLAVGVNLPSRRAIIRGLYRYVLGQGMRPVRVLEYKQMSGRAGRPQYDKYGESILYARNKQEQADLFNDFIFADPEPIYSNLGTASALRVHILALIATGFITNLDSAFEFMKKTFFFHQENHYELSGLIIEIIDFLETEQMLIKKADKLLPTAFGTRTTRLYIDPLSAIIIRRYLADKKTSLDPLTVLYLICSTPDMGSLSLRKLDIEKLAPFADAHKEQFNLPLEQIYENYSAHLSKIKTVWMILRWVEEEKEEIICDFFGIGPGDVHRLMDTVEWLLYSTIELAKLFKKTDLKPLYDLKTQIRYGIKSELIELVALKGIGRIRARNLHNKGLYNLSKLRSASLSTLEKIPNIGKELAASIKTQLGNLR